MTEDLTHFYDNDVVVKKILIVHFKTDEEK
jgi:hypothetical protein